ncbi:DUF4232 domain-containing protein [Actinoplanes oblitus]|uniref:DUF4232 domain-containing protein n=1 Tax=Actinoplanes oblitus TaxID=3040509 RepID=A0ABY8W879_9ACTN|nr:DUF4232 domain-containing protein [Actinoplanes oblitus]WIM94074.1 DUF4232 domain-containing protein [Actinoplanes oblitus]
MIGSRILRRAVPLAAVVVLAGCARPIATADGVAPWVPTPSAVPSPSHPRPSPSRPEPSAGSSCSPEGIRLEPGGGDAAAGLRVLGVTLVNCGTETYRLNGYPAVRVLDEDRKALDIRTLDGVTEIVGPNTPWDGPPKPVTLRPGQRAGFTVAWRNTYDDIRQPPANGRFLRIEPLAGRPARIVEPESVIDLGSTGRLAVSPWQPEPVSTASPR